MTVRERRQKQALRLTLPSIRDFSHHQRFQSPSPLSSTSSSSNSPTIRSLASFEKLSVLGHGNGGTVYKVCHRPTNEIYALKVLKSVEDTENLQKHALNEVEILKRVDSRFIVMLCDDGVLENGFSGTNLGDVCFLMEYMEGGSLHDLLQKHPKLSENSISSIARSVLEGLRYLHSMQIVHGDIKPSNLLINHEGKLKIADFGVSRFIVRDDEQQCFRCSMGTCAYMSPERIDPESWDRVHSDGYAGDIWSLGVVVMECFTGHFPLIKAGEKPDWITLMFAICSEEEDKRKILESASTEIQSFVRRCLEKDWRVRGTVEELLGHPFITKFEDSAANLLSPCSFLPDS